MSKSNTITNCSNSITFERLVAIAEPIEFNHDWKNGTVYYDHAVNGDRAPKLLPGQVKTCVSDNNRRLLLIGVSSIENVVVFDRYSGAMDQVLISNETSEFSSTVTENTGVYINSRINEEEMKAICETIASNASNTSIEAGKFCEILVPWGYVTA